MKALIRLQVIAVLALLAACTTSNTPDDTLSGVAQNTSVAQQVYQPTAQPSVSPVPQPRELPTAGATAGLQSQSAQAGTAFASEETPLLPPPPPPRIKKTYLINGLASNIGNIGYGFTNLSKKIPGSVLYNYASFVESSTIIRSRVTRELKAAYRADPTIEINLIGISFGANIVTIIAQELDRNDIPVNYLATLDGPAMIPIRDNVRVTDNFTCTNLDCFRTNSRLAWGNKKTRKESFKIRSSHIPLANHERVHSRILQQINAARPVFFANQ
ncbi:MAG: hypothetical protein AAFN43_03565 [Pseudomonadota bacterium]